LQACNRIAGVQKDRLSPLRARSQSDIDKFIADDRARWTGVVKSLNISLD